MNTKDMFTFISGINPSIIPDGISFPAVTSSNITITLIDISYVS